ncbi:hypothetical protein AZ022_002127, partial [Klebsiella pneumoniae]
MRKGLISHKLIFTINMNFIYLS